VDILPRRNNVLDWNTLLKEETKGEGPRRESGGEDSERTLGEKKSRKRRIPERRTQRGKNRKHARCEEGAEAFIFDLDGVITDTAQAHADAWKKTFDAYLAALGERREKNFGRFDRDKDYRQYVDGKPRYDGVRSFLASRGIELETVRVGRPVAGEADVLRTIHEARVLDRLNCVMFVAK